MLNLQYESSSMSLLLSQKRKVPTAQLFELLITQTIVLTALLECFDPYSVQQCMLY